MTRAGFRRTWGAAESNPSVSAYLTAHGHVALPSHNMPFSLAFDPGRETLCASAPDPVRLTGQRRRRGGTAAPMSTTPASQVGAVFVMFALSAVAQRVSADVLGFPFLRFQRPQRPEPRLAMFPGGVASCKRTRQSTRQ